LRVVGLGLVDKPAFPKLERGAGRAAARRGERPVYFGEAGGFLDAAIYERAPLPAGATFDGPAIVEQMDSTTVILIGQEARVDERANLIVQVGSA